MDWDAQVRRKVCMRTVRRAATPKLLGIGPAATRSPKKARTPAETKLVKNDRSRAAATACAPCMLPRPLVELLAAASPPPSSPTSSVKIGGDLSLRSLPVPALLSGIKAQEVHKLLEALVKMADRLAACLDDVRATVLKQAHQLEPQPQPQLEQEAHTPAAGSSARCTNAPAEGQHARTWLAHAMAWLRGLQPADTLAHRAPQTKPAQDEQDEQVLLGHQPPPPPPPTQVECAEVSEAVRDVGGAAGEEEEGMTAHVSQALESALLLECKSLQARLSKRVDAAIFLTPVDPERDQCPDYLNLIAHPMDLGTVAARLAAGHYHTRSGIGAHLWFAGALRPALARVPCCCRRVSPMSLRQAAQGGSTGRQHREACDGVPWPAVCAPSHSAGDARADVKRTFDNAMAYNPASHPVHRQVCALACLAVF